MGAFDDIPVASEGGGAFDDIPIVGKRKERELGGGEIARRAGTSFVHSANAYAAAPAIGIARIADAVAGLFGAPDRAVSDSIADRFVVPSLAAADRAALQPGETTGPVGGAALAAAPELGKMVPDIVEGAGLVKAAPRVIAEQAPSIASKVIDLLRGGATAGVPAGFRRSVERAEELKAAGVDPLTAGAEGAASGALTVGQFALPASAGSAAASLPARIISRGAQGAALNVASGGAVRAAENAMLPDQAEKLRQPLMSPETAALDAITGAIFGQMGGRAPRAGHPTREQLGYQPGPSLDLQTLDEGLAPVAPPAERPMPQTDYDPAAAAKAVTEALFPMPEGAPTVPDMRLIPKGEEAPAGVPPAPDVSEVPIRVPPELELEGGGLTGDERVAKLAERAARQQGRTVEQPDVIAVNSRGEAIPADENLRPNDMGTVAGRMQAEGTRAAGDVQARRAFDVAEAQRERKQGAQDVGGRDLREARAGGSTSREGTAATAPEAFTFLDVRRDRRGNVTSTGPEVKIEGEAEVEVRGKKVPGYRVSYIREAEGGGRELVYEEVPQDRVSELSRPAQPRFAQDINATSYAPPRGVGTGKEQPQPREAAQRITTEPSPEVIPAERAAQRGEATRAGRDVTDLAFERLESKGAENVEGVRRVSGPRADVAEQRAGAGQHRLEDQRAPEAREEEAGGAGRREEHAVLDDEADRDSLAAFEQERDRAFRQSVADDMRSLARTAGWIERGGFLVRRPRSEVAGDEEISRTKWAAQEWFHAMRSSLGRKGLTERGSIMLAVEKWLEGEPLNANERRTVNYMLGEVMDLRDQAEFAGMKIEDAQAADVGLTEAGVERTPQNLYDVDYLSRVDPDVLERLALQHGDDTEGFMRAVAEELNRGQADQAEASVAGESRQGGEDRAQRAERAATADTGATGGQVDEGELRRPGVADERGGAPEGEARPELDLEGETEQQLRQRAAEQRRVAEEERRREAAPPPEDFTLTGSDRPADEAEARGQRGLFEGGGTLSANPFANPKIIAAAVKWAFGDAKAWVQKGRELAADIAALRGGRAGDQRHIARRITSYLFDSAAADMRAAIRSTGNSATANEVMDKLHNVAGSGKATGETFHDAVRAQVNKSLVELHRLLGDELMHDDAAMRQIAALVRNPSSIRPGSKIHDAAAGIRKMLDATLKYMKDAGVEVGEVKGGYYPREYDVNAVMRDSRGFIEAAARAYRDGGMTPEQASLAARELHDGIMYGETNTIFKSERGATRAPFIKGRVFGKEVDHPSHPLNKFLMSDPSLSLAKYFERAAKRAEVARRFGDNFAQWADQKDAQGRTVKGIASKVIDEGGGAILQKLSEYIALDMGLRNVGSGGGTLRASSIMRTWGALTFLEKATLSSLTEFIVPAVRAGNVLDIGRSFKNTLADLFTSTKSAEDRRAFAEDLGLISGHISSSLASARFAGGEPLGRIESKVLDSFFKRTGLNQWTDATRVAAADVSRVFIRRLSKDMAKNGKLTKRMLAELGVPEEQAADFARYVLSKNGGLPAGGDLTGSMGELYRTAVRKFLSQSIMDPSHGSRPKWMSHPIGSVVGQLQAFNYAFYENVLKRTGRLAKEALTAEDYSMAERAQLLAPMLMLPLVTAAAFAIGEARDAVLGDPQRRRDETFGQKALKAVSRGTPIAPLDPIINYASSARYSRSATESFAGPALGTLGRAVDAARDVLLKNSENTNTQERRAAKAVWDILIEPTINLALYAMPGAPAMKALAAVATQAAGSGSVREKLFVEPVAGAAQQPGGGGGGRSGGRSSGRSGTR